jgi:preprotein translocase subunit SecG
MVNILLFANVVICVALIILILLQRSDPSSGGVFGGAGSGGGGPVIRNPLAKPTAVLAALFLVFSVLTAVLNKGEGHEASVMTGNLPAAPATLPEAALLPATAPAAVSATVVSPTVTTSTSTQ